MMFLLFCMSLLWADESSTSLWVEHLSIVSQLPKSQKKSLKPLLKQQRRAPLDPANIRQDIQTLYLAGDFEEIDVEYILLSDKKVHLRYIIKEAPVLHKLVFQGVPRGLQKLFRSLPSLSLGQVFYIEERKEEIARALQRKAKSEGWGSLSIQNIRIERLHSLVTLYIDIEPPLVQTYSKIQWVGLPPSIIWRAKQILLFQGIWEGQRISIKKLSEAQERIRSLLVERGWIQARVNLPLVLVPPNTFALTIRVESGPKHTFEVDSPLKEGKELLEILDIYPGDRITNDDVDRFAQKVYDWLIGHGYIDAIPKVTIDRNEEEIFIGIAIPSYKRQHFASLEIDGAQRLSANKIREDIFREIPSLDTQFSKGIYRPDDWEYAIEIVEALYIGQGFLDVQVQSGAIEVIDKKGGMELHGKIVVREGPQLKLTDISFSGQDESAMEDVSLPELGIYRPNLIKSMELAILEAHREQGFLDVDLEEERIIDKKNHHISFNIVVKKGVRSRLETLIIRGNRRTKAELIERFISLRSGEVLSPSKIEQTRKNLYGLGPFQQVSLETFGVEKSNKSLILRLEERSNLFMTLAGGLTTDEGAQFRLVSGHRNLFGLAHKLNLVTQAGIGWNGEGWLLDTNSTDWRVSLRYDAPKMIKNTSVFGQIVLREQLQETNFRLYRSGVKMGVSMEPTSRFRALIEYGIERVDLDDYDPGLIIDGDPWSSVISNERSYRWTSGGAASIIWDGRDSPFSPKKGGFVRSGLYIQDGIIGLSPSIRVQNAFTYNIDGGLFRYKIGGDFGGGVMQSEQTLPFEERFYLGGANSIRGYARNQAGPMSYALRPDIRFPSSISSYIDMSTLHDSPGQWIPVGGDAYWSSTAELHFPLQFWGFPHISVIGFSDVGMLSFWDDTLQESYRPTESGIQYSLGMGIRWTTSVGPVAIDLGFNPNPQIERGETYFMPYFSFGSL